MVEVKLVEQDAKQDWDKFVADNNGHILQSWEWGEFRREWGTPPLRLAVFDEGKIKAVCSLTLHKVPVVSKHIGYCGKGPVFSDPRYLEPLFRELKTIAREKNCIFIKFEPHLTEDPDHFFHQNLTKSKKDIFAAQTLEIDLTRTEEELLASFHEKWRYNIRLAAKRGVEVELGESESALEEFLKLQRETASRDKFFVHPDSYYRTLWQKFHPQGLAHILTAKVDGEAASSWFLFTFGDYLYYPYGSSSYEFRSFMPSHALMWSAIQFGKNQRLKRFDLWGSAKIKKVIESELSSSPQTQGNNDSIDPKDPWAGFTKFKLGFNPEYRQFIGAFDLVTNKPLYHTFAVADQIRWLILRTLK